LFAASIVRVAHRYLELSQHVLVVFFENIARRVARVLDRCAGVKCNYAIEPENFALKGEATRRKWECNG
jgi:hypothetical protein